METDNKINEFLNVLRLIIIAMIAGTTIFAVVVIVAGDRFPSTPGLTNILFPILVVFAAVGIFGPPFIRRSTIAQARRANKDNPEGEDSDLRLYGFLNMYVIASAAMTESVGLFSVVVYMLTKNWAAILITVIALVLLMRRLPNRPLIEKFLADANRE
ncbi:MAG: hypothetical protein ACYTF1_04690 [Planctomycetota bacterium]|jgi:hypothetical protein